MILKMILCLRKWTGIKEGKIKAQQNNGILMAIVIAGAFSSTLIETFSSSRHHSSPRRPALLATTVETGPAQRK